MIAARSTSVAVQVRRTPVARGVAPSQLQRIHVQPKWIMRAETTDSTTDSSSTGSEIDSEKLLKDLQAKWDNVENKSTLATYVAGGVVAVWLSSTLVGAINNIPLLPKFMELVGLGYSAWFTYRYLLFKSSREELIKDIDELKKKITGSE